MKYARDLVEALDLEVLDRDLFRGLNTSDARERLALYGGQVLAQALMAAGRTVATDRPPHSLHGYFLRRGKPERPVLLQVDRDRDGGSFSARHVAAIQDGEVIFSMLASFHQREESPEVDEVRVSHAPPPDECTVERLGIEMLDVRQIPPTTPTPGVPPSDRLWVRSKVALGNDPLMQACALAYVSDLGTGFGQVDVPGLAKGGPSIDHAMWFQHPVDVSDWLLLEQWPIKAGGARGVYAGALRDQSGTLAASLVQEMLLRGGTPPPG